MDGTAVDSSHLLSQLEAILDSHPCIDELGFIHPSQFAALDEEANGSPISKPSHSCNGDTFFWSNEHKLGISTLALIPLYGAAKDAFMDSFRRYKMLLASHGQNNESIDVNTLKFSESDQDIVESEVMRHSRSLVLLSCDFGTAWNSRKLVILRKQQFPLFMNELLLSTLVLSCAPKSEHAWSHRRWVIKMIADKCANLQEIVERESVLVKTIAENSKMNYRAWNHRCWLVSRMSHAQVILELRNSRDWTVLHVADNSCLHYRTRLLLQMVGNLKNNNGPDAFSGAEFHQIWKEELHWDELLIRHYIGREALWLHRRFLSLFWMKHLTSEDQNINCRSLCKSYENDDIFMFINAELKLLSHCTIIPDNVFEDYEAQTVHSATYFMWLAKFTIWATRDVAQENWKEFPFGFSGRKLCKHKSIELKNLLHDDSDLSQPPIQLCKMTLLQRYGVVGSMKFTCISLMDLGGNGSVDGKFSVLANGVVNFVLPTKTSCNIDCL